MTTPTQITRALAATAKLTAELATAEAMAEMFSATPFARSGVKLGKVLTRCQILAVRITDTLDRLDARTASVEPSRRAEVGQRAKKNRRRKGA